MYRTKYDKEIKLRKKIDYEENRQKYLITTEATVI